MRMFDIIKNKRDGKTLSKSEIDFFIDGYVKGDIPDYQAASLLMAIYFNGMDMRETRDLTLAVKNSGEELHLPNVTGFRVDKHSTGGVGDKTSLVIGPIVSSLGIVVAKMSGRGLGHTGGTVDKLESFEGLRVDYSIEEFEKLVSKTGIAIIGQSQDLAPADKKLYALRDVTATIDSLPLIVSSIMGKKLAANDDGIVLDVKCGSGSFMKTKEDARKLAEQLVYVGNEAGKKTMALITDMDTPLGYAIGNSLEVIESIQTLQGEGPEDLTNLCIELATYMLTLAGIGSYDECKEKVIWAIKNKKGLETLAKMVEAQGGDPNWVYNTDLFPKAKDKIDVKSKKSGYISHMDSESLGIASMLLGAGRNTKQDKLDYTAGIYLYKKTGDYVEEGDTLATLYTSTKKDAFEEVSKRIQEAIVIGDKEPQKQPLILDIVE